VRSFFFLLNFTALILLSSCVATPVKKPDVLVQTSTIDALLDGVYDGNTTFESLEKYGDFGIGTFNGLDGEMLALDGKFYQIKSDGRAYPVDENQKTPFAVVTYFRADQKQSLKKGETFKEFKAKSSDYLDSQNIFYAIRIIGKFKSMLVRSVPKQEKPYKQLKDVVKQQSLFEYRDVYGTIVGFYCPKYIKGLNVPGFHFHFLNRSKKNGGHVIKFVVDNAVIELDEKNDFFLSLPISNAFRKSNLNKDRTHELHKVEQ